MNYLHLATNTATPLHVIRAAHPHMSIPDGADLTGIGYAKLHPTTPPTPGPNQRVVAGEPVLVGGEWREDWGVVALTPEEIEAARRASVPASVTMRQARLALLGAGLLAGIDAAINSLPSPQKEAARIEWEYSQEVQRQNGFVSVLAPMLGLTEAQTDALFLTAAGL